MGASHGDWIRVWVEELAVLLRLWLLLWGGYFETTGKVVWICLDEELGGGMGPAGGGGLLAGGRRGAVGAPGRAVGWVRGVGHG